jgi:transcription initiation factor TFIIH subunit 2
METTDYAQRNRRVIRDMIRYLYVIVDASRWMRAKDPVLAPAGTRLDAVVNLLLDFVQEYYDQNPLSHLGFVLAQNGEAEILSPLSSSAARTHKLALRSVLRLAASEASDSGVGGEFSLQNGLEVAGRSLGHQPRYGSREVLIVTAALSSCDPGSLVGETLPKLLRSRVRVSSFALTAELYICRKLAQETRGTMGVCLDRAHLRDWMHNQCVPPPATTTTARETAAANGKGDGEGNEGAEDALAIREKVCEMIPMGFPTRTTSEVATLVHDAASGKAVLARTAYTCPQCQAKNLELPSDCAVCGLKLVLAPHLARSFHHLFPVNAYVERPLTVRTYDDDNSASTGVRGVDVGPMKSVSSINGQSHQPPLSSASSGARTNNDLDPGKLVVSSLDDDRSCYACLKSLVMPSRSAAAAPTAPELLRFQCPDCHNYFCVDCDAYVHETLHNCPGCLCEG